MRLPISIAVRLCLATALLCACLALCPSATAFDVLAGLEAGTILQSGEAPEMGFALNFKAPVVTRDSAGYQISVELGLVKSDRLIALGEDAVLSEIVAGRFVAVGKKKFDGFPIYIALTTGAWAFENTVGSNEGELTAGLRFGLQFLGMDVAANCDVIFIEGPDMYFPSLGIRILTL